VRRLAALDLPCSESALDVQEEALYAASTEGCSADVYAYRVRGCGKEADYGVREEGALELRGISPAYRHPEPRQWLEWVWTALQAQQPGTPFSAGRWYPSHEDTEQVIQFNPAPGTPPWRLTFRVRRLLCKEAPAKAPAPSEEGTQLSVTLCGGSFEVSVGYEGPKAAMPAPQGVDLPKLARALRRQLWILGRSR